MRILHVTPTYFPATRYGGPIYSVHGLARAQAWRGDNVQVFTTNVDGPDISAVPTDEAVDLDGVRVNYFECGYGRRFYRSPHIARALEHAIDQIDVLHLHSAFLWPPLIAARIAKKRGLPYVYAPRGMLSPELVRAKSRLVKSAWINLFERKTIREAAALHLTTKAERDDIVRLGLEARRVAIIPNGVEIPETGPSTPPSGLATILCLGRISWKKGLERLIRAFAWTRSRSALVIAGNDDEQLTPRLRELAARLGVAERVRFPGPVEGEAKWRLMQSATVFALASYGENFGNVVLEAMASGLPVVVTPEVGLADTVASFSAGLVAEGDPESFGRALDTLLSDKALRISMGSAGRRLAETRFSWSAIAQNVDALYASILSGQ